ncbi:MAG TPA: ABC transporter permease, partial [Bacteroidales bacterium]|nr:ABC transporter permease [Bacteroidales bacterium]
MISHGFRMMWNQKKKYGFILFELFAIFLVVFITVLYLTERITTYMEGTGCEIDNVYFMDIATQSPDHTPELEHFRKVRDRLAAMKSVESVSMTRGASPYRGSISTSTFEYGENRTTAHIHQADDAYPSVLKVEVILGRWFNPEDDHSSLEIPVVINRLMANRLFGDEDPVGNVIPGRRRNYVVKGVISKFKERDYDSRRPHIFMDIQHPNNDFHGSNMLIRYKNGYQPQPKEYAQNIYSVMPRDQYRIVQSSRLEGMKKRMNSNYSGDILFVSLIVGFLLFNLVLGLIGILGYNINQRWSEMGIRRAVGSTRARVRRLIFLEMFALTVMAIVPAFIVIVQIPAFEFMPLTWVLFAKAMVISLTLIFFLVFISVLYP